MSGRPHTPKKALRAPVRLPQLARLGPGPHRLSWFGRLHPSEKAASSTGLDVGVFFHDLSHPRAEPTAVRVPLVALPHLKAGTIWRNQMQSGFEIADITTLEVDMSAKGWTQDRACDPHKVIRPDVYRIGTSPERCYCRIFPLTDGSEIVVPTAEVLRMFYFFHSRLIPALIGGGLDYPDAQSPGVLPWRPTETYWLAPGVAQIGYAQNISEKLAMRMARLYFDPMLRRGASFIHKHIRSGRLSGRSSIYMPPLSLPFPGRGTLKVRALPLPVVPGSPRRQLVLSIHGMDFPLPYTKVTPLAANDNRSTEDRDQATGIIHRPRANIILPDDGALDLYGSAGDSSLEGVDVEGHDDEDNATGVEVVRFAKLTQTHQSSGTSVEGTARVDSAALDVSGLPTAGTPGLSTETTPDKAKESDSLPPIDMRLVFKALVTRLSEDPVMAGWKTAPYGVGNGSVNLINLDTGKKRSFYVMEVSHEHRALYVLEARHAVPSETFSVLICQLPNGKPFTEDVMRRWLLGFPYPHGTHWVDHTEEGLSLLCKPCKHQPRKAGKSAEDIRAAFVERLRRHILHFIDDPLGS